MKYKILYSCSFKFGEKLSKIVFCVVIASALGLFSGCGGGSSSNSNNPGVDKSLSGSSSSSSSSGAISLYDTTYCSDFTTTLSHAEGNVYTFNAPGNECFGVLNDGSQKKSVPLTLKGIADETIEIGSTIKLYNSTPEIGNTRRLLVSFELTNTASFPVCFVNASTSVDVDYGISLFNSDNEEIALLLADNYLKGVLISLNDSGTRATKTCLNAGQTLRYFDMLDGLPVDVINAVSYASIGAFSGSRLDSLVDFPNLAVTEMAVEHPDVTVSFVNDSGRPIKLDWYFMRIAFFDAEGYAINTSFLYLDDYAETLIESGDMFVFSGNPLYKTLWPVTAVEAVVYLDWGYVE